MSVNKKTTDRNAFELYTEWYLQELVEAGYIKKFVREPFSLDIFTAKQSERFTYTKTKSKVENYNILPKVTYTPDYIIYWDKSAEDIFYTLLDGTPMKVKCPFYAFLNAEDDIVSLCDVKPAPGAAATNFMAGSSYYTFPYVQKILYHTQGIYINKTIPIPYVSKGSIKSGRGQALFTISFCPKRYKLTDSAKQERKMHYKFVSLKEYILKRQKDLQSIYTILGKEKNLFNE